MRAYCANVLLAWMYCGINVALPNPLIGSSASSLTPSQRQTLEPVDGVATTAGQHLQSPPRKARLDPGMEQSERPSALLPRMLIPPTPFSWLLPGTSTTIVVQHLVAFPGNVIAQLLQETAAEVQEQILHSGDGPIAHATVTRALTLGGIAAVLKVLNVNTQGRPITLSMMNVALAEVWDLMMKTDFGMVTFDILDAGVKVANADIDIVNKYVIQGGGTAGDLIK